ncbi:MAG: hypothetical protein FXV80_05725 [Candidatus Thioglobus sp.]|nr:MAG: hypothetical protein FXV80_05725 [Candidatus Thioglobus sp.]
MLKLFTSRSIRVILAVLTIILSFLTIIWHNQNRTLYQQDNSERQNRQIIVSKQKQLLSEFSEQTSAETTYKKAVKKLRMQQPVKIRRLDL